MASRRRCSPNIHVAPAKRDSSARQRPLSVCWPTEPVRQPTASWKRELLVLQTTHSLDPTMNAISSIAVALLLVAGSASAADTNADMKSPAPLPVDTYRIGVDDLVQVSV